MKTEGLLRTPSLLGRTWAFEGLCPFQGPSKKVLCSGLGSNLDHRSKFPEESLVNWRLLLEGKKLTASWDYQGNLRKTRKGLNRSLV